MENQKIKLEIVKKFKLYIDTGENVKFNSSTKLLLFNRPNPVILFFDKLYISTPKNNKKLHFTSFTKRKGFHDVLVQNNCTSEK